MSEGRILIADDHRPVLDALRLLLRAEGWEVTLASSVAGIEAALADSEPDVLLMDLNYSRDTTSGREGLDMLQRLRRQYTGLPIVVMTAWGSVETAVQAMRHGARDYVEKPWQNERLLATLRVQSELGRALRRSEHLQAENDRLRTATHPGELVAQAPAMQPLLAMIDRIGPSDANVLITGEHGSGKEVLARRLHATSLRREQPLVTVNAGGLGDGVFDSELFGHVKGAFTDAKADRVGCFELAHGGTLFLDEIGNMPLGQQATLLRVLQTGELRPVGTSRVRRVDVRVLAATNVDLHRAVQGGSFRADLLYRLNTVEMRVPALRERPQDIAALADVFVDRYRRRYAKDEMVLAPEALAAMMRHPWPGNVRELQHAVERAVLMARGSRVEAGDLALGVAPPSGNGPDLESMSLDDAERFLIRRALDRCDGNVKKAADELGVSRSALYRRLERHGMSAG